MVVSDADDLFALIVHSILIEKKAVYVVPLVPIRRPRRRLC